MGCGESKSDAVADASDVRLQEAGTAMGAELERESGTFACSGTFLDDPVLWGERKVRDDAFVVEVGSDGRTVTGSGESFYGKYDVEGTLDRTGGQSYAKLRLHKLKKLKPWYYEHCYVCGSDEKSDGDLLLCDGQDGRSPASHAIDATLFPWSRRLDGVEAHKG